MIWSDLKILLPQHYGDQPCIETTPRWTDPWSDTRVFKDMEIQERWGPGLLGLLELVISLGHGGEEGKEKWSKVTSLTLIPHPGVSIKILRLLDSVSPYLRHLTVGGKTPQHIWGGGRCLPSLDSRMARCLPAFPLLTSVRLNINSRPDVDVYLSLCSLAPTLESLEIDWRCDGDSCGQMPRFQTWNIIPQEVTKLRYLRVTWGDEPEDDGRETDRDALCSLGIIQQSPLLEHLALEPHHKVANSMSAQFLRAIAGLHKLHTLDLDCDIYDLNLAQDGLRSNISRFILQAGHWHTSVCGCPDDADYQYCFELNPLPQLTDLYFVDAIDAGGAGCPPHDAAAPTAPGVHRLLPAVSTTLRNCPLLRHLHVLRRPVRKYDMSLELGSVVDQFRSAEPFGLVNSMTHGDEQVLIAWLYQDYVETGECYMLDGVKYQVSSTPVSQTLTPVAHIDDDSSDPPSSSSRRPVQNLDLEDQHASFTTPDRRWWCREFKAQSPTMWRVYTDYKGLAVPMEVIKAMRAEEWKGIDWDRRGVEVGEAAWEILLDWHRSVLEAGGN